MTRFDGLIQNAKQKQGSKPKSARSKKNKPQPDAIDVQTSKHSNISNTQPSNRSNVPDIQASEHLDTDSLSKTRRTTKGKSTDSQYLRTTLYLSKSLHKRLKVGALEHDMEMSDIAEAAISAWLDNHS